MNEASTIVVGVDGSANGQDALGWAVDLARATGARVVAVHALGLLDRLHPGDDPVPSLPNRAEIERVFTTEWCAALDGTGGRDKRLLRDGPPVEVVLHVADEEDADLIVVGSRGTGGHPELLLGSTSTQLAQRARCPVVIVPSSSG